MKKNSLMFLDEQQRTKEKESKKRQKRHLEEEIDEVKDNRRLNDDIVSMESPRILLLKKQRELESLPLYLKAIV